MSRDPVRRSNAQRFRAVAAIAALIASVFPVAAITAAPPSIYSDYHPGLADLMTMAVQPRHTKLGLAIRARNWTYAAYEAGELRGSFNRITRSMPTYEGVDTGELLKMSTSPIETLVNRRRGRTVD